MRSMGIVVDHHTDGELVIPDQDLGISGMKWTLAARDGSIKQNWNMTAWSPVRRQGWSAHSERHVGVLGYLPQAIYRRASQNICHVLEDGYGHSIDRVEEHLIDLEESVGQAVRTLEARVDALDNTLWHFRQKQIDKTVAEKLEQHKDPQFDMHILDMPGGHAHHTTHSKAVHREVEKVWDTYRASFTVVMTKGYLQAVEQLRERIMVQEWDQNTRQIAQSTGVTQFEAYCADNDIPISLDAIDSLYENPEDVSVIDDAHLRMRARSCIRQEEARMKKQCYDAATDEARRLAKQFSEAEFLSKVLPDPIEHGLVSSVETFLSIMAKSTNAPQDL